MTSFPWLPSALFTLGIGIIGYFIKRTVNDFEAKMTEIRMDFRHQAAEAQKEFREENAAARNDFREGLEAMGRRVDKIEEALMGMPYKYTLKEDYIRSMAMVDKKLDQILEYQRKGSAKE